MASEPSPPSLKEFKATYLDAFSFVASYGFRKVSPKRSKDPFQVWFRRGDDFIIIHGEGYGTHASAHLEHLSGVELAIIYLVPPESRPPKWKPGKQVPNQLEQIRQEASWLQTHGEDFLRGDLDRFFRLAKPLPSWKEKLSNMV